MTFEEFQATRRWSDDLAAAVSSDNWEMQGTPKGNLYLDNLYIDHVEPHWPEEARKEGDWHLLLGRDSWISNDLTALERRLYKWAADEGYFNLSGDDAINAIAHDFAKILEGWLTKEEMQEVRRRNATIYSDDVIDGKNICASHDFCDANEAMAQAFEQNVGHPVNGDSDEDCAIWNSAWTKAKHQFLTAQS